MSDIDVSYIIPCYNSAKTLPRCVAAILSQQGDFKKEIIIVDSSEIATLPEALGNLATSVTIIHSAERLFPGQARNKGLESARGRFIALIDSDVVLNPQWTTSMSACHQRLAGQHGSHLILGGSMINDPETSDAWSDALTLMEFYRVLPNNREELRKELPAANLYLPAATVKELDLFFSAHRMAEDILFCKQALEKGARICLIGTNTVRHMIVKDFFQYTYFMGAATCIVRLGNPNPIMKLLFILSMPFGSLYKFTTIFLGLVRNEPRHLGYLFRRLPHLCMGLLSLHAGIMAYPFNKSRWKN